MFNGQSERESGQNLARWLLEIAIGEIQYKYGTMLLSVIVHEDTYTLTSYATEQMSEVFGRQEAENVVRGECITCHDE